MNRPPSNSSECCGRAPIPTGSRVGMEKPASRANQATSLCGLSNPSPIVFSLRMQSRLGTGWYHSEGDHAKRSSRTNAAVIHFGFLAFAQSVSWRRLKLSDFSSNVRSLLPAFLGVIGTSCRSRNRTRVHRLIGGLFGPYARTSLITFPCTSVSRMSRPPNRKVDRV